MLQRKRWCLMNSLRKKNLPEVNIGTNPVNQQPERFGFVQELGEGAYGKVWKADDAAIGRTVAVKSYKFAGSKGAKLLSIWKPVLSVKSIIQVFRYCTIFNKPMMVSIITSSKYVEGQTLEDVIERLRNKDPETHKMFKHLNKAE